MAEAYGKVYLSKEDDEKIYWGETEQPQEGELLFSFDGKTILNFWDDYPEKLTPEQTELFKKERPILAELKPV